MVMKGGLLLAIRYDSGQFTKDVDFSTRDRYEPGMEQALIEELERQLDTANESLPYDTMCRVQRAEVRPARAEHRFQTLWLSVGYAPRSRRREMDRLLNKQAPTIVETDYSYNDAVYDVEILALGDGDQLHAHSFLNLIAEKLRSLLQQPVRRRNRRQDVYDLHLLITESRPPLDDGERASLLALFQASCRAREIEPDVNSLAEPVIRKMAMKGVRGPGTRDRQHPALLRRRLRLRAGLLRSASMAGSRGRRSAIPFHEGRLARHRCGPGHACVA